MVLSVLLLLLKAPLITKVQAVLSVPLHLKDPVVLKALPLPLAVLSIQLIPWVVVVLSAAKVQVYSAHQIQEVAVAQSAHRVQLWVILKDRLPRSALRITADHKTLRLQPAFKVDVDHWAHKDLMVLHENPSTPSVHKLQLLEVTLDR